MNFEKLLGQQVFKSQKCNPFQSTLSLSISPSFSICYVNYNFFLLCLVSLNLVAVPTV